MSDQDDSIAAAVARLESAGYDSAREQERVAEAARTSAGALNTVTWWKESLARFEALEGRAGEVYCDRCGAVRFVPTLVGLTHAHCPRVVQGTWRAVPSAQR